jgi:hypothetical protein
MDYCAEAADADYGGGAETDVVESADDSMGGVDSGSSLEVVSAEDQYLYSVDNAEYTTAYADETVSSDLPLDDPYVYTQSPNDEPPQGFAPPLENNQPTSVPLQHEDLQYGTMSLSANPVENQGCNQPMNSSQFPQAYQNLGCNPSSAPTNVQMRPQPPNNGRLNSRPQSQVNARPRPPQQNMNNGRVNNRPQQNMRPRPRPRPRPNPQNQASAQNNMNPGGTPYQDPQTLQNTGTLESDAEQYDNGTGYDVEYNQLGSDLNQVDDEYDNGSCEGGDGDAMATMLGGIESFSFDEGGGEAVDLINAGVGLFTGDAGAAIGDAASSVVGALTGDTVAAVTNVASNVVNTLAGDSAAAVQAGVGVAMSGVRIAASIGNWNELRQKRKDSQAQFAAVHGASNPVVMSKVAIAAQLDEALLVLSVLGQRLVVLDVINFAELPQAHAACRTACAQADSGDLLEHFDTLDGTLQYAVTAALFFCAACWPMHIYRGFGTGVLGNFLWGCPHPQYNIGQTAGFASVDRLIAFLKSMPREVQLLTRLPHGLNRFTPSYEKNDKQERRRLQNAYRQFVREIEIKGHPQPRDRSFRIVSWHIPFATWNSPFTFKNSGHYWEDFLRWQMDPGRLLHAFTIGGHLDLNYGEMMWLPPGVTECLARWLVGLSGTTFKLVPSSALDYSQLKLTPETRRIMLEDGFETVKAVRDPLAETRKPVMAQNIFVPAPPPVVRKPAPGTTVQHSRPSPMAQVHGNQPKPAQTMAQRPMNQHPATHLPTGTQSTQQRLPSNPIGVAGKIDQPGVVPQQFLQHNATVISSATTTAASGHSSGTTRGVPMGGFSMAAVSASQISPHPAHKMTVPHQINKIPNRKPANPHNHAGTGNPTNAPSTVPQRVPTNPLAHVQHPPSTISRTSTISSHHSTSSHSSNAPSQHTFTSATSNTTPSNGSIASHPTGIPATFSSYAEPQAQYTIPPSAAQPVGPPPAAAPVKRRPVPRRPPPVQKVLRKVKAVCDFEPEDYNELGFVVGDLLDVLKEMDDGWWEARLGGKIGAIPPDYVEVIEE